MLGLEVEGIDDDPPRADSKLDTKTRMPNGELSMLVDLGSKYNVIGRNTLKGFNLVTSDSNDAVKELIVCACRFVIDNNTTNLSFTIDNCVI